MQNFRYFDEENMISKCGFKSLKDNIFKLNGKKKKNILDFAKLSKIVFVFIN